MAATQGIIDSAYVSAIDSMLNTREILKKVSDIYNEEGYIDIMMDLGNKLPVKQGVYYNFVNDPIFKLIDTTGATVTNSGTRTVTITTLPAGSSGFNRPGDLLLLPAGAVAVIMTVTPGANDTIVVKGVSGANLTIVAGDKLSSFSVVAGENSDTRANLRYGLTKYFNKVQIFRETCKITDVENTTTLEVEFNGQPKIIIKDQLEKATKLKGNINAAFIGGDVSDSSFTDGSAATLLDPNTVTGGGGGGAMQTTRGMDKYITTYGQTTTAGTPGSIGNADFAAMADALIAARTSTKQYLVAGNTKVRRTVDDFLLNLNNSGLTSVRMDVPVAGGKTINTRVTTYTYSGFEWNFADMPILDHSTLFSQTTIAKSLYCTPLGGKVKTVDNGEQPNMQIRYFPKTSKFGNDMIGEYHNGGDNPINPTGTQAAWITEYKTIQGLEILGAQHFGRIKVLA